MKKSGFYLRYLFSAVVMITLVGGPKAQARERSVESGNTSSKAVYWKTERDYIGMLAAYSVVYKGWQKDNARGYNIGSVLLSSDSLNSRLVFWARNCNAVTHNETQHGEVRLMIGYLAKLNADRQHGVKVPDIKNLAGCTVYTTLEPCAQCSGMMTLQKVRNTLYGESDPGFGKALERLQLDSSSLPNGYQPYPRPVISERANIIYCNLLEEGYAAYQKKYGADAHITDFLKSEVARLIFESAYSELKAYKAKVPSINDKFLDEAKKMVESVPKEFVPLHPEI
ncbi:nucleoside deaminase [Chlorobium sp. BLA1]|uniref:nucleoside deaminase n=1 Tax=Candidatus Chlorobium masyuteum TaxID=2716876 RepID=UPI00141E18CE|nr:nucleoside deaminase [Candidatus Chlorobium masyuteum]NHQ59732.1 nucleoside deaminase [Candidatus Chlorobium masyuteum]